MNAGERQREADRLASVALAREWGVTDTDPVPGQDGFIPYKRIGTATWRSPDTVIWFGVYGFKGIADGRPLALAAYKRSAWREGGGGKADRHDKPHWGLLAVHFTGYEPA